MPLSEFQVFPVFGTKRKHETEWSGIACDQGDIQMDAPAKRMCHQTVEGGDAMNEMLEINHNSIPLTAAPQQNGIHHISDSTILNEEQLHHIHQLQLQQQQQQQLQLQQELHQQVSQVPRSQQPDQAEQMNKQIQLPAQEPEQHNTMVMDLCDETYSNVQLDQETRTMYNNMDSDCVPNLQQYGLAFCGDMSCVGGDRSPTSGRIRCYCKPSWEGMMDIRPYVSDYY